MTDEEISNRLSNCVLGDDCGTFAAGTLFGGWRLTAFIAKGGTAEVYCAEHIVLGTAVAVKVLSEPLTDSRKARFLREAKLLAELKSSAFPAFHGYGEVNGRPYIAEELLEPGDLPMGDRQRAKYLLALCNGLKELHARGVVHRDLKPANILFRKTGEPVIVDLGLAKSVEVPVMPDGVSIVDGKAVGVGTPEYAAPEQFTGGDITPAADVHALGVLAEKLLGDQPRLCKWGSGHTSSDLLRKLGFASGDTLSASAWKKIIRRATSSIASERYQSVEAFAAAIRRRHWLRNGILAGCVLLVIAAVLGLVVALSKPTLPVVLELHGQKVLFNEPIVLKPGRTYRVIGPGTLDADLSGFESTLLWMTNCVVLNRSKNLPPTNGLRYELTRGVYLNLIGVGKMKWSQLDRKAHRFFKIHDGAYNELRLGGPDTISRLMQLKTDEAYENYRAYESRDSHD